MKVSAIFANGAGQEQAKTGFFDIPEESSIEDCISLAKENTENSLDGLTPLDLVWCTFANESGSKAPVNLWHLDDYDRLSFDD